MLGLGQVQVRFGSDSGDTFCVWVLPFKSMYWVINEYFECQVSIELFFLGFGFSPRFWVFG